VSPPDLHHHGISVTDLDRAVEFYRSVFGFELVDRYSLSDDALAAAIGVEAAAAEFAQLDAGAARVELVEYEGASGRPERETASDVGATHLGLHTEDVDAVYDSLPDDVETISDPQTTGSGTRILFVRDPDGNLIELLETGT
jgi:catechol 2,3-dioxygenase-like lactoylglutathione lyase family enzyme